jgi:hypothetical protein
MDGTANCHVKLNEPDSKRQGYESKRGTRQNVEGEKEG